MSIPEEPQWVVAKRKSDRRFRNGALGTWLACFPIALIMILASRFEYDAAMRVAAAIFLLTGLACVLVRRGAEKGSLVRSFSTALAVFSFVSGTATFVAGIAHLS
ncbi:MAG: hypothetical protein ABGW84_05900 [Sphingomonadaceae bacterium]